MLDFFSHFYLTDIYENLCFLLCLSAHGKLKIWNDLSWLRLEFCIFAGADDKAGVSGPYRGISCRQPALAECTG